MRTPLKWAGGKTWLVPWFQELDLSGRRLVEPFCGASAVSLGLEPAHAFLNDSNPALIGFLRCLQAGLSLPLLPPSDSVSYYVARARFNVLASEEGWETEEAAGLFYYLNRTGFNGLCRFNRRGEFNVPFGGHRKIHYESDLRQYSAIMSGWTIGLGDYSSVNVAADDFVYCDPPYDGTFVGYSGQGFDWEEQCRLAHWAASLSTPVLLSNTATARVLDLYRGLGFRMGTVQVRRHISANGSRPFAAEMLAWRNFETSWDRIA